MATSYCRVLLTNHPVATLLGNNPVSCQDIAVPRDGVYRTDTSVTVALAPGNVTSVTIPIVNIDSKWLGLLLLYIDTTLIILLLYMTPLIICYYI